MLDAPRADEWKFNSLLDGVLIPLPTPIGVPALLDLLLDRPQRLLSSAAHRADQGGAAFQHHIQILAHEPLL